MAKKQDKPKDPPKPQEPEQEASVAVEKQPKPQNEQEAIAKVAPDEQTGLALANELFGDTVEMPTGSTPPVIKIQKENPKFDIGDSEEVAELIGNILFIQRFNIYYEGKFDPANPTPPACASMDSITPDAGEDMQSARCAGCEQNKHNAELGSRPCQNRILVFFLKEDTVFPSVMNLAATNLSKKAGSQDIMSFPGRAANKVGSPHYQIARVRLSLNTVTFGNGNASTLNVEVYDEPVMTTDKVRALVQMTKMVKDNYRGTIAEVMDETRKQEQEESEYSPDEAASGECPI